MNDAIYAAVADVVSAAVTAVLIVFAVNAMVAGA